MANRIESAINRVSDLNWVWWPLLRFRPKKTELFSHRLVFVFAVFVTVVSHLLVVLLRVASNRPVSLEAVVVVTAVIFACVFAWFWVVAHFWNRRALRLLQESA